MRIGVLVCILILAVTLSLFPPASAAVKGQLVLGLGSSWENQYIFSPFVAYNGSAFLMWYNGENKNGVISVGLATSLDGISWIRYPQNPVLRVGSVGEWDHGSVLGASILYEGAIYKMWYSGKAQSGTSSTISIGYATSSDGIHWTKYAGNPVFAAGPDYDRNGVLYPAVISLGSSYVMYYLGDNGTTALANSTDGTHWTRIAQITWPSQDWDKSRHTFHGVLKTSQGYLMAYHGQGTTALQIGFASSTNGIEWTPYPGNPVITYNFPSSGFDNAFVYMPMVIAVGDSYYVYYTGSSTSQILDGIGLAILPASQYPVPEFSSVGLAGIIAVAVSVVCINLGRRFSRVHHPEKKLQRFI
jgi:predicted GH43/DUF377 family glycosyl hydrolase